MDNGIVDSKVHLLRAEKLASEFEVLGVSIIALFVSNSSPFLEKRV